MKRFSAVLAAVLAMAIAGVASAATPQVKLCFPGNTSSQYTVTLIAAPCPTCASNNVVDTKWTGSYSYVNGCKVVTFKSVPAGWYYANASSGLARDSNTWPPVYVSGSGTVMLGKLCFDSLTNPVHCN